MIPVKLLSRGVNIVLFLGFNAKGKLKAGIQISSDNGGLMGAGRHFKQAVNLLVKAFLYVVVCQKIRDFFAILLGLFLGVLILAKLLGYYLHLLTKVIIPLIFVHTFVNLVLDLVLKLQKLGFVFKI